jgi:hypothetical protein
MVDSCPKFASSSLQFIFAGFSHAFAFNMQSSCVLGVGLPPGYVTEARIREFAVRRIGHSFLELFVFNVSRKGS